MITLLESLDVERLRGLIGNEVHHNGKRCQIIEILEDGPALILQHLQHEATATIQADQHGEAHRKVPSTITVPVLDGDGLEYSKAFSGLNITHLL